MTPKEKIITNPFEKLRTKLHQSIEKLVEHLFHELKGKEVMVEHSDGNSKLLWYFDDKKFKIIIDYLFRANEFTISLWETKYPENSNTEIHFGPGSTLFNILPSAFRTALIKSATEKMNVLVKL